MLTLQISEAELQALNYERFHYPCPLVQRRLQAVYFKAKFGMSNENIGRFFDLHAYTVSKYVHCYQEENLAGLCKVGYGTNQSKLETHQSSILADFAQHPPSSVNQAKARIAALTGLERSPSRVLAFMKRHQLRFRKLGHVPAKADGEKQEKWIQEAFEPFLAQAKRGECHLLFMDAAHFVLAPFLCAVWSMVRMFVKAPAGRKRLNVLGAVNAINRQVNLLTNTSFVNADTIAVFLRQLREAYAALPIILVLDNARYQHCAFIQQLAGELNITLLFLPAYSPNLNIIERLWKFVKKKVLYGKYYPDFDQFQQAIIACLHDCNHAYQAELKSLLTCKFQRFNNQTIYPM